MHPMEQAGARRSQLIALPGQRADRADQQLMPEDEIGSDHSKVKLRRSLLSRIIREDHWLSRDSVV